MKFATADVLGASTGRLLGDIGGIYKVLSFLIGRDAYTHDLAFYGRQASAALRAARSDLPVSEDAGHITENNYRECLATWEKQFGPEIDLPDSLRECLADNKSAMQTLAELVDPKKIIPISVGKSK